MKKNKYIRHSVPYLVIAALLLLMPALNSCEEVQGEMEEFMTKEKTLLVYMIANNDLSGNAVNNFADMQKGYIPGNEEGNLVVYYHIPNQNPLLLNIIQGSDGKAQIDTAYKFPARNSATKASLESALKVTATLFPAKETGLMLWSHATGWLPEGYYANPAVRSFGNDSGVEMDLKELKEALPYKLSFIIFDACLMGGIEVAYELKDSTDHIIFSPAEILAAGFPYSKIMGHIFESPTDLQAVAEEYYNFYQNQSSNNYATISLIKTSELESVAEISKAIFAGNREKIQSVDVNTLQRYFRNNKHWFYDFRDFIGRIAEPGQMEEFDAALDKAVLYKAATDYFMDLPIRKYSGMSIYVPVPENETLYTYYRTLEWNKACGMIEEQQVLE